MTSIKERVAKAIMECDACRGIEQAQAALAVIQPEVQKLVEFAQSLIDAESILDTFDAKSVADKAKQALANLSEEFKQ